MGTSGAGGLLKGVKDVEAARESMRRPSFMTGLFAGQPRFELLAPSQAAPRGSEPRDSEFEAFLGRLETFLRERVDAEAIERDAEIPRAVLTGLAELGALGINIPKEYGGLGCSQRQYNRVLMLVGSHCNTLALLLSAHQSIGVSKPVLHFGTEAQKREWLPRIARGALSAFALTEPGVGSDPAGMSTVATLAADGGHYVLNGEKLWCTNGGVAEVMVLMAKVDATAVTAFIVDRETPGIEILNRCSFMGNRGISNVWLRLRDVHVPKENVIGEVGKGLRVALATLNTGRVSLAALCLGMAKQLYGPTVWWAGKRETFGKPIGRHELNTHKLARMAADIYAMEAVDWSICALVDRAETDHRVEAAAAKLFNSERLWDICDAAMQVRGGRGYEKAESMKARGEPAPPVEQLMRDARLYLIGEGASEILTLFIAREVWDPHLRRAGGFLESAGVGKLAHAPQLAKFYLPYYARQWKANGVTTGAAKEAGQLVPEGSWAHKQLDYVERTSRKLARAGLYAMALHGAKLEQRQALVSRLALIGVDLYVIAATAVYTERVVSAPRRVQAERLAQQAVEEARRRIDACFRTLWDNTDDETTALGNVVLNRGYDWLSEGSVVVDWERAA
ncbi:MAG TPA: acyl-CoA dehydrogenase family protein [Chloroflexota bacterium]|nr:acyl-CoA dehydrogenase family protein [Chloroflexota bacterium]